MILHTVCKTSPHGAHLQSRHTRPASTAGATGGALCRRPVININEAEREERSLVKQTAVAS